MSVLLDFLRSVAGIPRTRPLDESKWKLEGNAVTVKIGDVPELQTPGGAVYLKGKGLKLPILIVCSDDGAYHSFENRCTHFGRKLDPVHGEPLLRCCSVSHSTFDYNGVSVSGPGKKPVNVYPTQLRDGNLIISLQAF